MNGTNATSHSRFKPDKCSKLRHANGALNKSCSQASSSTHLPLGCACFDAAGAAQSGQGVLLVGPVAGTAQAHVDGLAAGVHAADGWVSHAARPAVPAQRALSALGRGAAEGGAPGQAVGGASGGVDRARTGGLL